MTVATHTASGHITLVQEERFRLVTDAGQGLLFTLAHNANVSAADLHRLRATRRPVVVRYQGEPDLTTGVAVAVEHTAPG